MSNATNERGADEPPIKLTIEGSMTIPIPEGSGFHLVVEGPPIAVYRAKGPLSVTISETTIENGRRDLGADAKETLKREPALPEVAHTETQEDGGAGEAAAESGISAGPEGLMSRREAIARAEKNGGRSLEEINRELLEDMGGPRA